MVVGLPDRKALKNRKLERKQGAGSVWVSKGCDRKKSGRGRMRRQTPLQTKRYCGLVQFDLAKLKHLNILKSWHKNCHKIERELWFLIIRERVCERELERGAYPHGGSKRCSLISICVLVWSEMNEKVCLIVGIMMHIWIKCVWVCMVSHWLGKSERKFIQ